MNYAALLQAIQDYAENDEATFVTNIPQFVRSAEQKIYRAVRIPDTRTRDAAIAITAASNTATIPTGFLLPLSLKIVASGVEYPLLNKDESFLTEAYPATAVTGRPRYYAVRDDATFALAPTPDANYTATLNYLAFPTSIVSASTTWLGTYAESALLYGSLVEAYIFMKGESDVLNMYKTRFDEEIVLLQQENSSIKADEYYGDTAV